MAVGERDVGHGEADDEDEKLSVTVVSGDAGPGANVTLEVTDGNGAPVEGASVHVEDEVVGQTDTDGQIDVSLPDDEEVDIEV